MIMIPFIENVCCGGRLGNVPLSSHSLLELVCLLGYINQLMSSHVWVIFFYIGKMWTSMMTVPDEYLIYVGK